MALSCVRVALSSFLVLDQMLPVALAFNIDSLKFPLPPRQSQTQQGIYEHHATTSKQASGAATAGVLEFLDRADLRAGLEDCCPAIAKLPAAEILKRFREEVLAAELAHSFPPKAKRQAMIDETLAMMKEYPVFMNGWQAELIDEAEGAPVEPMGGINSAEENLYGCPPFQDPMQPTWDEAAGRMIYTAHNMWLVESGSSPHFGQITAVFRRSAVQDMVVFSPVDTGLYYSSCHPGASVAQPNPQPPFVPFNCSGWNPEVLGTMASFDHMILANWAVLAGSHQITMVEEALKFFSHSAFASANYSALPMLSDRWTGDYWEAVLFGAPRLSDVKFVMPMFNELFGTSAGAELARLAGKHSWPVFWVFGEDSSRNLPGKVRLLDPRSVAYAKLNITVPEGASYSFEDLWTKVASARKSSGTLTDDEAVAFWDKLKLAQVWVAPATAHLCGSNEACVGVAIQSKNSCICSATEASKLPTPIMV